MCARQWFERSLTPANKKSLFHAGKSILMRQEFEKQQPFVLTWDSVLKLMCGPGVLRECGAEKYP